ncbi:hypothetical protein [Nocardioides marmorisolisilvae]|uniref:Uncharacterized protein n=1 Tax=Nocardioides marmorisolisilvae TaxID=1542737 RepID=A0A3N0DPN7_9ACTN|nr:hypothetical protein [Nocardioides marmorisolisilvae]RNL77618.1 hypothetical protein EFL95_16550 [Nocardioides marmorisolisilvae]
MFEKTLVATPGEIAVREPRAAFELGFGTVAATITAPVAGTVFRLVIDGIRQVDGGDLVQVIA